MNAGNEETRAERLRFLLLVVLGAAIVRGLLFGLRADYLDWDEALYILMARNVLEGSGITLNGYPHVALGPLVPLATALISLFSGLEPLIAHHVLMVLAGSALIIPVY